MGEFNLKLELVRFSKLLYDRGYMVASDGNLSVKIGENEILITPSGLSKGFLRTQDIIKIDFEGRCMRRDLKPSSEYKLHVEAYKKRSDIKACIHTHPPYATAFAVSHKSLEPLLSEAVLADGFIPVAEYGAPSTEELAKSIDKFIESHNSILLANHGIFTVGKNLEEAYYRTERVEFLAKVTFISTLLGGAKRLSEEEIKRLESLLK